MKEIEIILIDDCSTDDTLSVIAKFMEEDEIKEYTECIEWIKKEIGNAITLSMIESVNVNF